MSHGPNAPDKANMTPTDYSVIETLNQMPLPSCRMLPDSTIVEANAAYFQLLGYGETDVIGRQATSFVEAKNADHLHHIFANLTPQNPSRRSAKQFLHTNGKDKWLVWNDTGIFNEDGTLRYVWSSCWDVTEEYRYGHALEELIHLTSDRSADAGKTLRGILAIGCDYYRTSIGVITRESEQGITPIHAFASENDVKLGEAIPYELSYASITFESENIVAIADLSKTKYKNDRFYKNNPLNKLISSVIYIDDERFGTISFASREASPGPFTTENIQFCRILVQWATFTLSREKQIEEISRNEEIYRQIFDVSPIMMHTISKDRRITNVNNMWAKTLGYSKQEIIGKDILDFVTPESAEVAKKEIKKMFNTAATGLVRNYKHKNGTIIETELATLDAKSTIADEALAVVTDVTDRNRAQRSLTRGNDELHRANEGLKRFNAIAAHDLQEPLRKIGIYGGILKNALYRQRQYGRIGVARRGPAFFGTPVETGQGLAGLFPTDGARLFARKCRPRRNPEQCAH